MAEYERLPGTLNLTIVAGDDLALELDFDIDLTGYTFSSKVAGRDATVTAVDLANGQIIVSLTETETLEVKGDHTWYLDWTIAGDTVTVLAGTASVILKGETSA